MTAFGVRPGPQGVPAQDRFGMVDAIDPAVVLDLPRPMRREALLMLREAGLRLDLAAAHLGMELFEASRLVFDPGLPHTLDDEDVPTEAPQPEEIAGAPARARDRLLLSFVGGRLQAEAAERVALSQTVLCAALDLHVDAVRVAVRRLLSEGYLIQECDRGPTRTYRLTEKGWAGFNALEALK